MIDVLAAWAVRSVALIATLAAVLFLARVRNPFVRKNLWTATLAVVLAMPALMRLHGVAIHATLGWIAVHPATEVPASRSTSASLALSTSS